MYLNPNENRTRAACILGEQFRRKGYNCEEIREKDATILVFTHERNHPNLSSISKAAADPLENFLRSD